MAVGQLLPVPLGQVVNFKRDVYHKAMVGCAISSLKNLKKSRRPTDF